MRREEAGCRQAASSRPPVHPMFTFSGFDGCKDWAAVTWPLVIRGGYTHETVA